MDDFEFRLNSGENVTEYIKHPALYKHKELLQDFASERIFCIYYSPNNEFYIEECCDEWFGKVLNKKQCLELSEMFKEMADYIE
ncbi:MAG: hypothetical protein J6R59_10395 [Paludibacteraceae bacterium]|nr:hypothetical protein [Paludibacteraceae bacterium]